MQIQNKTREEVYGNEQVDRYLDKTTVIKMAQHESPRPRHRWCIDLVLVNEAI